MMLSQGKHSGERILSRLSAETITTDQLTPEQKAVSSLVPGFFDSHSWGFGVSVITILMTQCAWTSPRSPNVDFWTSAYQAIDD